MTAVRVGYMATLRFTVRACMFAVIGLTAIGVAPGLAQEASDSESTEDLAKKVQNPVADLISLPFQNNLNFGVGPDDGLQYVLNVQPVVPFHLTENWNLISRTIVPLISQPVLAPGIGDVFGLGDIQLSLFLSPAKSSTFIWGVGPIFQFPSATDDALGQGKWGVGPTVVGLTIKGPWVAGMLVNNVFSFAGDADRRAVNQMLMQPFLNYNFKSGWYLSSAPIITANWEADSDNRWVVPIGGGVGRVFRLGKLPLNAQLQAFYNVVRPDLGPDWSLRFQLQFLFPTGKKK